METSTPFSKFFTKANIYFAGTTVVLIATMILLLVLLRNHSVTATRIRSLINMSDSYRSEIDKQQASLKKLTSEVNSLIPSDAAKIYGKKPKLTDITRYFDRVATDLRKGGQAFSISTISYNEDNQSSEFVGATLAVQSSEANLVKFLRQIETSGIAAGANGYLMELRSFSLSLNSVNQIDESAPVNPVYNVSIGLKIYAFEQSAIESEPSPDGIIDPTGATSNLPA